MKSYKLLKDLPDLASGVIFEHDGFREQYSYGNNSRSYHSYTIENNPEWFEEVKEKEYEKSVAMSFIDTHYIEKSKIQRLFDDAKDMSDNSMLHVLYKIEVML